MAKLTRERKVYVALLGCGLAALAIDRVLPRPAAAAATDVATSSSANAPAATPANASLPNAVAAASGLAGAPKAGVPWSNRLAKASGKFPEQVRDAFRPSEVWITPVVHTEQETPDSAVAAGFKARHTLRSIVGVGDKALARVDESTLRVGDSLGEFRLVRIDNRSVRFERGGLAVELILADPKFKPGSEGRVTDKSELPAEARESTGNGP